MCGKFTRTLLAQQIFHNAYVLLALMQDRALNNEKLSIQTTYN
jgi:hypothetical protein